MSLRFETFTADLDGVVAFYTHALGFSPIRDERAAPVRYVAFVRGVVQIGAAYRAEPLHRSARRPPTGLELVLEVNDLVAEHDHVVAIDCPLEAPLRQQPWGLTDFRILDPGGHYLRITNRVGP